MRLHEQFEWDGDKANTNLKKHGVTFDTAAFVLSDQNADVYHHEHHDAHHSYVEDRYITVASHPQDRRLVFTMIWTERQHGAELVTRIISARFATAKETKQYVDYLGKKTGA